MNQFQHVSSIGQKNRVSSLEDNIKGFLDWSFLQIGGFVNVEIPTSTINPNNNFHTLKMVEDPSLKSGRVWAAPKKDWIYENSSYLVDNADIVYGSSAAIAFSGINLNNTFIPGPTGSGNYGYSINYNLGQVLFNNPVSSNSNIQVEYSYRYVQTYKANEATWWKEIQKDIYSATPKMNGDMSITANHRVQLPAVLIENIPRVTLSPYQLGTTENIIIQDVFLHIFSNNPNQRNNIIETLLIQKDNSFWLYDINSIVKNNAYPINQFGGINPSGKNYNILASDYKSHWCTIRNTTTSEINTLSSNLHNGIVRWSVEIFP